MAIQGITPAFDPPSTPWWKKALGLLGATVGVAAIPFTGGASAGLAKGAAVAGGLLGTAANVIPGGRVKGESKVIAPTGSSAGPSGISPIKPQAQRAQGNSTLDSLTAGISAVGGLVNKAAGVAKQRPEVGAAFVSDAQQALQTPEAQRLLGPQAPQYEKFLTSAEDYWKQFLQR